MLKIFQKIWGLQNCTLENVIQPFPFKGGFEKKKISEEGERMPLTGERKSNLTHMVIEVEKLFHGSNIHWQIDGGLSISLLRGEFLGEHRDLDVAVEESELKQLQKVVEKNDYGFFVTLRTEKGGTMYMKRVNWKEFAKANTNLFWIIAVDKQGQIEKDLILSFINVHIIRRNKSGNPLGEENVELPAHWFTPSVIDFHGYKINVASPLKTAYYKLHSIRNYDLTDLRHMFESGLISQLDIEEIEKIIEREPGRTHKESYHKERKGIFKQIKQWG